MALQIGLGLDGKLRVRIQKTDGTCVYADGMSRLPSGVFVAVFSRWFTVLKELEEMINSPRISEGDLQKFFEAYPELLTADEYDRIVPQARIMREDGDSDWVADFVLHPFDQTKFCKILELKVPRILTSRTPKTGHARFYTNLLDAIRQLRDYGKAFHSPATRRTFREKYKIDVFLPDLHLVVGRKWDLMHMKAMHELQRDNVISIDDWDTLLARLRRQFI